MKEEKEAVLEEKVESSSKEENKVEKELSNEEKLDQLREFRKSGSVTLDMSFKAFKQLRNNFKNKTEWEGPNEAYLLCILCLDIEQAMSKMDQKIEEVQKVALTNSSIETMGLFINKLKGSNVQSAQNNLSMIMVLNQAIAQIQSIDKQIKELESTLEK